MFYKGLLENRFFIISDSYIGGDGPHSAPCLVYKINDLMNQNIHIHHLK